MKKRDGLTLIEMTVVLVILTLFIYMVGTIFTVTFDAYQYNRKTVAKMAAQTNVDSFFEIFEKELMYSGSMHQVIANLPGFNQNPLKITRLNDGITKVETQYALAEKIILTKKDKGAYTSQTNIGEDAIENTYFALYPSDFPATGSNVDIWALAYEELPSIGTPLPAASVTVVLIESASPVLVELTYSTSTLKAMELTLKNVDSIPGTYTYLSPLLYEPAMNGNLPIKRVGSEEWHGEIICKNTFSEKVENGATSLIVTKYIPTIDATYTMTLIDHINYFEATATTDTYIATISYDIPDPKNSENKKEIVVSRRFINPN
ncbi:MAG TPA: prepilin-type N-terminal cleavage/methylation domain-containing protein [Thermotogota bacterium]|nr:prepilin-type N-terminal cleavage/methylation domain-containing protein [Thermotogota bacterium]